MSRWDWAKAAALVLAGAAAGLVLGVLLLWLVLELAHTPPV